jgi:hypothetical protein
MTGNDKQVETLERLLEISRPELDAQARRFARAHHFVGTS